MDLFEIAARKKYRFATTQGSLSVEELWDLPLKTTRPGKASLNDVAISLNRDLKESATESFVDDAPTGNTDVQTMFDIVKRVIAVRKEENAAEETRRVNAEKRNRIREILADKQDESLKGKSAEELTALLNSLDN